VGKEKLIEKLSQEFDYWEDHPEHTVNDWIAEVQNNDTRMGYWPWVAIKVGDVNP
jgi:hypothetical protein